MDADLALKAEQDRNKRKVKAISLMNPKPGTEARVVAYPTCDLCSDEHPTEAHYDCKTQNGQWGYLCEKHFKSQRAKLGLGLGQRLILSK